MFYVLNGHFKVFIRTKIVTDNSWSPDVSVMFRGHIFSLTNEWRMEWLNEFWGFIPGEEAGKTSVVEVQMMKYSSILLKTDGL